MGNVVGRAVRLSRRPAPQQLHGAEADAIATKEAKRAAELRAAVAHAPSLEEQAGYDLAMPVGELVRAVKAHRLDMRAQCQTSKAGVASRQASKEQRAAGYVGRIPTSSLRAVYADLLRAEQQGRQPDLGTLAHRYGATASVLKQVVAHARLATVERATDGRLVARPS